MTAHRIDLVDEDDARCVLLALLEQVAYARGAYTDEHLHEVRARDAEERHTGFTGDRPCQQRLAGTRRTHQQHTLRDATAEALEFLGILEECDDLFAIV